MTHAKLIERLEEHAHWRNAVARTVPEKTAALLREAAAALREREWQSMDSAPKDGTEILLRRENRITSGAWTVWEKRASEYTSTGVYLGSSIQDGGASWVSWDGGFTEEEPPTAWMPLPTPPETVK